MDRSLFLVGIPVVVLSHKLLYAEKHLRTCAEVDTCSLFTQCRGGTSSGIKADADGTQ